MFKLVWLNLTVRDSITMMTLFKSRVLPRLDYGSQLWSLHLVKHHSLKHITGMQSLEYSERLVSLKLYSLQRRKCYCIIYVWKIIEGLVSIFCKPYCLFLLMTQMKVTHCFICTYRQIWVTCQVYKM